MESVPPTHAIAQRICPGSNFRRVGTVVACAFVDAFVERAEHALDRGADAVDVSVCVVAELAVLVRCRAVGYAVKRVVRGWAVAE
jgi:predicted dinucleotide-utilizing enzyme